MCYGLLRLGFRWCVEGVRDWRPRPGTLLVCNHISHLDPPWVGVLCPVPVRFMAMRELFRPGVAAWIFDSLGCIPTDREGGDGAAVRQAVRCLRAGACVGLFPEGGLRTGANSVLGGRDFSRGAAWLAALAGAPVQVVTLLGTDQVYDWKGLWRRPRLFFKVGRQWEAPRRGDESSIERLNRELSEEMRSNAQQLAQRWKIQDHEWPRSAQERWGRS